MKMMVVVVIIMMMMIVRRASQRPQGGVAPSGGARQGPIVGYVLRSAAPTGPSPWLGAYRHRQYTVPLCLGVRDPGIAELRSIRGV